MKEEWKKKKGKSKKVLDLSSVARSSWLHTCFKLISKTKVAIVYLQKREALDDRFGCEDEEADEMWWWIDLANWLAISWSDEESVGVSSTVNKLVSILTLVRKSPECNRAAFRRVRCFGVNLVEFELVRFELESPHSIWLIVTIWQIIMVIVLEIKKQRDRKEDKLTLGQESTQKEMVNWNLIAESEANLKAKKGANKDLLFGSLTLRRGKIEGSSEHL